MSHQIYLIDDDARVREALSFLLRANGERLMSYDSPQLFLDNLDPDRPGCVLVDLQMPQLNGLMLIELLNSRGISWPTIVITGHGNMDTCRAGFQSGIIDFLTKPVDSEELFCALEKAKRDLIELCAKQEASKLLATLSPRETEILNLICNGTGSREIASLLNISIRTVDAHRANITEKLGTASVARLVSLKLLGK